MNKRQFLQSGLGAGLLTPLLGKTGQDQPSSMPSLHDPVRLGAWNLPNRIVMAPLTRSRASTGRVPNELMAEYYRQRATAGLIISEATAISPQAVGYADTPGLWSEEQVAGWKLVTQAVHEAGGRILAQLWHVGRISDPVFLDGNLPVAPSAIRPAGTVSLVRPRKEFVTPRALEPDEIPGIIADYKKAADNAKRAGFDGVELHGANGYLPDQFLQDSTNQRTDDYGGSVEKRARFLLEALDALIAVWGPERVGLHLAPRCDAHDMGDSDPAATFGHVADESRRRGIAFLFLREGVTTPGDYQALPGTEAEVARQLAALDEPRLAPELKKRFAGPIINNMNLTPAQATELLRRGEADALSWGRQYIANPDLVARFAHNAPLNAPNPATFYGGGKEGYTDYPSLPKAK